MLVDNKRPVPFALNPKVTAKPTPEFARMGTFCILSAFLVWRAISDRGSGVRSAGVHFSVRLAGKPSYYRHYALGAISSNLTEKTLTQPCMLLPRLGCIATATKTNAKKKISFFGGGAYSTRGRLKTSSGSIRSGSCSHLCS